ncbi:hypothetical protein EMIHUDRAFT_365659, partial [Emiliania huxleyi CCMP1516]|uniref:Uncharacterized protein n=2 Tax=Emiliania huxleyi TaxID=2903 RepID=A0A0D3K273_EMIH1
ATRTRRRRSSAPRLTTWPLAQARAVGGREGAGALVVDRGLEPLVHRGKLHAAGLDGAVLDPPDLLTDLGLDVERLYALPAGDAAAVETAPADASVLAEAEAEAEASAKAAAAGAQGEIPATSVEICVKTLASSVDEPVVVGRYNVETTPLAAVRRDVGAHLGIPLLEVEPAAAVASGDLRAAESLVEPGKVQVRFADGRVQALYVQSDETVETMRPRISAIMGVERCVSTT